MACSTTTETIALRDQLVLGDAWEVPLQFKRETAANNCTYATFDISTATTVTCEVRNMANDTVLLGPKTLTGSEDGADFTTSLVVTNFSAAETAILPATTQYVWLRVRVDGKSYPDYRFSVVPG